MNEPVLTQQEHDEIAVDAVFRAVSRLVQRSQFRGAALRPQLDDIADAADRLNALVIKLSDKEAA